MIRTHSQFGKAGEKAASAYLKKKGYRILEKNFRTKIGEIDIVAEHKKVLVFVEVKARSGLKFGTPLTAVTPSKQKKLEKMARVFLAKYKVEGRECRFDVVAITGEPDQPKTWKVELLKDAFRPGR